MLEGMPSSLPRKARKEMTSSIHTSQSSSSEEDDKQELSLITPAKLYQKTLEELLLRSPKPTRPHALFAPELLELPGCADESAPQKKSNRHDSDSTANNSPLSIDAGIFNSPTTKHEAQSPVNSRTVSPMEVFVSTNLPEIPTVSINLPEIPTVRLPQNPPLNLSSSRSMSAEFSSSSQDSLSRTALQRTSICASTINSPPSDRSSNPGGSLPSSPIFSSGHIAGSRSPTPFRITPVPKTYKASPIDNAHVFLSTPDKNRLNQQPSVETKSIKSYRSRSYRSDFHNDVTPKSIKNDDHKDQIELTNEIANEMIPTTNNNPNKGDTDCCLTACFKKFICG